MEDGQELVYEVGEAAANQGADARSSSATTVLLI
jgi:hypothetical protein